MGKKTSLRAIAQAIKEEYNLENVYEVLNTKEWKTYYDISFFYKGDYVNVYMHEVQRDESQKKIYFSANSERQLEVGSFIKTVTNLPVKIYTEVIHYQESIL